MQLFAPSPAPPEIPAPPRQPNQDEAARDAIRNRRRPRGREFFILPTTGVSVDSLVTGINTGNNNP